MGNLTKDDLQIILNQGKLFYCQIHNGTDWSNINPHLLVDEKTSLKEAMEEKSYGVECRVVKVSAYATDEAIPVICAIIRHFPPAKN